MGNEQEETAIFANGCFWCTEAIFQLVDGVISVESGYIGGSTIDPTYKEVCGGDTGHAEAIKITYDKDKTNFEALLKVFWESHDPTTLNRQGADVGTQYRSAIFYKNDEQREIAYNYMQELDAARVFQGKIITSLEPMSKWYPAEKYHQNYFNDNKAASYCQFVIRPKIEKYKKSLEAKSS